MEKELKEKCAEITHYYCGGHICYAYQLNMIESLYYQIINYIPLVARQENDLKQKINDLKNIKNPEPYIKDNIEWLQQQLDLLTTNKF